jgi:hypothetical protein
LRPGFTLMRNRCGRYAKRRATRLSFPPWQSAKHACAAVPEKTVNSSFLIIPFRAGRASMVLPAQHSYSYNDANSPRDWFTAYSNMEWLHFTPLQSADRFDRTKCGRCWFFSFRLRNILFRVWRNESGCPVKCRAFRFDSAWHNSG